ncbi:MAG: hypothetical protein B193_0325 [Solidesulfovibrio magneticus str. Maddingley MBC34]|uniref:Uncharacterized protein n=1 Tax=Solidesulfovibrio magneticus str. Maddingley MBC34 TaxID=1206767 RepID=K6GVQ6_9BACT|nr:MAG: hypothetical protein B193_0325 [Solidesulfovibrio magneticus str. Maddingley MBC34]
MSAAITNQTAAAFDRFYSWCLKPEVRKYFLVLIIINITTYLSVLRANFLYRDDIIKTILNNEGWEQEGRFLSYLFSKIFFFGTNADASPFTQIAAILIITASSLAIGYVFCRHKPILIIYLAPLCIFPYIFENLSYKFYAPWLSLAILTSSMPTIFLSVKHISTRIIITFICILACLNIYQIATGLFLVLLCQNIIHDLRTTKPTCKIIKTHTPSIAGFILAFIAYYCEIQFITPVTSQWGISHSETVFLKDNWIHLIATNVKDYLQYIYKDWVGTPFWFIIIINIYVVITMSLRSIFQKSKIIHFIQKSTLYIFLIPFMIIAPHFPQLLLIKPVLQPRTFLSLGALTCVVSIDAIILLYNHKLYKTILLAINAYLICNFIIIGNIYGNLLSSQEAWESNIMPKLAYDLKKVKDDMQCHDIYIRNNIGYSPSFENISNSYRVLRKLIEPRLGNEYFPNFYLRYYGLDFRSHIKTYYGPYRIITSAPRYDIGVLPDNTCFVSFKD